MDQAASESRSDASKGSILTWYPRMLPVRKRGREKVFYENVRLSLRSGTCSRIDALLRGNETRLDFIRQAIEDAIARRLAGDADRKTETQGE